MPTDSPTTAIAHVIQLSVAPVFLLSGIGAMLAVMTSRLSRIVDRARIVETLIGEAPTPDHADARVDAEAELMTLSKRARLISISISLCTVTALLIAGVVAVLFLGAFAALDVSVGVALLFVAAMLAFITALLFFLREVSLAIASLSFGKH